MTVALVVQAVLVLAAVAVVAHMLRAGGDVRLARRRLARARSASGEVVAVDDVGGLLVPTVRYHVDGARHETRPRTPRPASRYLVGQPVDVRYDPQDPAWMTVEAVQGDARVPRPPYAVASAVAVATFLAVAVVLQVVR